MSGHYWLRSWFLSDCCFIYSTSCWFLEGVLMFCPYLMVFWFVMYLEVMCEMQAVFLCLLQLLIRAQECEVDFSDWCTVACISSTSTQLLKVFVTRGSMRLYRESYQQGLECEILTLPQILRASANTWDKNPTS